MSNDLLSSIQSSRRPLAGKLQVLVTEINSDNRNTHPSLCRCHAITNYFGKLTAEVLSHFVFQISDFVFPTNTKFSCAANQRKPRTSIWYDLFLASKLILVCPPKREKRKEKAWKVDGWTRNLSPKPCRRGYVGNSFRNPVEFKFIDQVLWNIQIMVSIVHVTRHILSGHSSHWFVQTR